MARAPATFKQSDVMRAVKGAMAAGVEVARVRISLDGSIEIHVGKPENDNRADAASTFDVWKANHADKA